MATSGGISEGAENDVVKAGLSAAAVRFAKVAMQPGMPQAAGTWAGLPFVGLPGNRRRREGRLLELLHHAAEHGWSTASACRLLGLDPDRAADWRVRRALDRLADLPPGNGAVHGLLEAERAAIVERFTGWGEIDGSSRSPPCSGSAGAP